MDAATIQGLIDSKNVERNEILVRISKDGKDQRLLEKEIRRLQSELLKAYQSGKVKPVK